ncbi:hypothetical protein F0562_031069 [Nyssa sinensis]|uniref:Uncharacterized protein n=1 Tax=Nyssa sinensis TaxID=561372 RepID=A0A5J5AVK4_9ASTE|nr:hypothetical protein F0562_031069 [Nyssa sinensis]
MGIPAFYRWLIERYPLVVVNVREETPVVVKGVSVPIDTSRPNPNGIEFDNLYLDMNGIIHPCFHPEGLPGAKTYDEVFKAIFKYIDRIFSMIRPRKLIYLAIDGVAPRAKMNQQRSRRFKAAKNADDEVSVIERVRALNKLEGKEFTVLEQTKKLDSNVITPGTEFMTLLSSALRYYLHLRMNMDPGWRGIKVILSDASVPGEGEHKIMSYIRLQRNLPGFNPNTRHCLYGLDADLIMLALATHEIHFSILREHKGPRHGKDSLLMNRREERGSSERVADHGENIENYILQQQFQFVDIWVLRDYLASDLRIPTINADLEHLIDDFVFMCLFVGNDFLPHVPSLEISEGAIDLLMTVYKKEFVRMGGHLTNSSKVNLECVERFVQAVGSHENAIFRRRSQEQKDMGIRFRNLSVSAELGEEGWKEGYYAEKFEVETDVDREKVRKHTVLKYMEGICWVMHYYYQGVCSWQWFYPYHYAPFASDFYGLDQLGIHFTLGKPFKPIDQLMAVLPAASAHALPLFYRQLMMDASSPISDFYPTDFELDMNGKRFAWQAICKLPFVSESRLLEEIAKVEHTLTDDEKQRNSLGLDLLFVHISHPLAVKIFTFCNRKKDHPKLSRAKVKRKINPEASGGMNGYMYISDKPVCPVEIYSPIDDMESIAKNKVISVFYKCPSFQFHIPRPPKGVIMPSMSISKHHVLPPPVLWHEKSTTFGRNFSERPIPKSVSGPSLETSAHQLVSKNYLAKQQESMGCRETVGCAGVDDSACQSNLKPTDCEGGDVDEVGGNNIGGEPRKNKGIDGHGGPDNKIKAAKCPKSVSGPSLATSAHQLVSKYYFAKRQESMGCRETVGCAAGVDDSACQSNLKPTDCEGNVDGVGENNIDGEPRKKKPRKNKGIDGCGGPDNKIEAAKCQEGVDCPKGVENTDVDILACQQKLGQTDCAREVDGGGENYIDSEPRKRKRSKDHGAPDKIKKKKELC